VDLGRGAGAGRARSWSGALALAAGAALALGPPWLPSPGGNREAGEPRWVVADRDARRIVLLDDDLLVVERREVPWPTHVRAAPGGALWIVSATLGHPRAGHELLLTDRVGRSQAVWEVPPVLDLEVERTGRAWILDRPPSGSLQVRAFAPGKAPACFSVPDRARAIAMGDGSVLVAAGDEGLGVLDPASGDWRLAWHEEGCCVLEVAAHGGPRAWLLVREGLDGSERVVELDGVLATAGNVRSPGSALVSASQGVQAAVWSVGATGDWARRLDPREGRSSAVVRLPALGAVAAFTELDGGLLVAAGGALLRLDRSGRVLPGQGGFARLVDLDALGPR